MDEYKHCMNCLMSRSKLLEMAIQAEALGFEKGTADKEYNKILQWFKDTYELKRKASAVHHKA